MFALSASTRNAARISPTIMGAFAHTQAVAHNTHPIGLGLSIAGPSNASKSTITVLSGPASPTFAADVIVNSFDATASNGRSSRRSALHRRDSGNTVCSSLAAPVIQCAATLPSMPFSPATQTPMMLQSAVMPWVFTPPVTTPATPGHGAHDEGYFPEFPLAQSFQAASAWMSGVNQVNNTSDTRPNLATRRRSFTTTHFISSGGPLVSNNFATAASAYLEARNTTTIANSTTSDSALEHVGLGITNMRISESDFAETTEMRLQNQFIYDNDNTNNTNNNLSDEYMIEMEDEDGWDADVEMDEEETTTRGKALKSHRGQSSAPINKMSTPNSSSWRAPDFTISSTL